MRASLCCAVALLLAGTSLSVTGCEDDPEGKSVTACSSDSDCSDGACFEQACYTACTNQDDCDADSVCESVATVDSVQRMLCVPAPAVAVECLADDPELLTCPAGTWSAEVTREVDFEGDCVVDGMVTHEVIVTLRRGDDGQWIGSFTTTNNVNTEDGSCFSYTNENVALSVDEGTKGFTLVMTSPGSCQSEDVELTAEYGLSVTPDACCQTMGGESWMDPVDPCDPESGRASQAVTFERVEEPAVSDAR